MPKPSDPENYSIDQMMERLKHRPGEEQPHEDGKLVTRSDGTVALKVRKRKRRSHQPHKEQQRRQRRIRMIQATGALLLVVSAGFAIASAIIYANSAPYRENVQRMIAETSGAEVQLDQFRVTPTRVNAGRLALTWPEGTLIQELTARGISGQMALSSFLGKSLTGEELAASEVNIRIGMPSARLIKTPKDRATAAHFRRYTAPKANISFGKQARPDVVLRDSELSFEPSSANFRPQLLLNNGTINARLWPKTRLDRAHIELRDGEIDVVGMRFLHENDDRGQIDLSGTIIPLDTSRPHSLDLRMESFLLDGLLGKDLGEMMRGRVNSTTAPDSNRLLFSSASLDEASLEVTFSKSIAEQIDLRGFAFLGDLARLMRDNWFERPIIETEASGVIRRSAGAVSIHQLNFVQRDRIGIRGTISVDAAGRLSGQIELGITDSMLLATDNSRLIAMFQPADDGFRWVTLDLGGSLRAPSDNFMLLYQGTPAAADQVPGRGIPSFEDLIAPE
ncbi:MAG: hypothetical protein ACO3RV_01040 [Luteolibacter sp.]